MQLKDLPAIGQPLEGAIFVGLTTTSDGTHCAVVLLDVKPSKRMTWMVAKSWAAEAGGVLPTRPVAALLFANAKDLFKPDWHWTSDEYDASYAWGCSFNGGSQLGDLKSAEGRARAVRLIPLTA